MSDIEQYKQEICDIGDRLYKRGFAAANDGNITYRISENEVLCTPTMVNISTVSPNGTTITSTSPSSREVSGANRAASATAADAIGINRIRISPAIKAHNNRKSGLISQEVTLSPTKY